MEDSNIKNDNTQDDVEDDILRPLNSTEKSVAKIYALNNNLKAMADIQENYLEFLQSLNSVSKDLSGAENRLDEDLGLLEARKKLGID